MSNKIIKDFDAASLFVNGVYLGKVKLVEWTSGLKQDEKGYIVDSPILQIETDGKI